jgi:glutaredoxin
MRVTLYSKPDCPLCDEVKQELAGWQEALGFALGVRNIEEDPAEFARFRYLVPVIEIAGGPLLYPPHEWHEVDATLRSYARKGV